MWVECVFRWIRIMLVVKCKTVWFLHNMLDWTIDIIVTNDRVKIGVFLVVV